MEKLTYDANNHKIIRKVNEIIEMVNEQEAEKEKENNRILKELEEKLNEYAKAVGLNRL